MLLNPTSTTFTPARLVSAIERFTVRMQSVLTLVLLSATVSWAEPVLFTPQEAHQAATENEIVLVDIRTPGEWAQTGIGDGAIALDMTSKDFLRALVALRGIHPEKRLVFICRTGNRSGHLTAYLTKNKFENIGDVPQGMMGSKSGKGWLKHELPIYKGEIREIERRIKSVVNGN